tara:strand:- start:6217 stop:7398 length:1182 start_codon:yes stop_codon:yes gene_type:complete
MQLFLVNDVQTGASRGFVMGAVRQDGHLPFPMPDRPFAISQEWRELTFMHWKVDPERLKPHLPDGLGIDLFNGEAYVGVIPFVMKNVRPRGLPSVPGISTFAEFNVRTYVIKDGQAGVFFLTLDAKSLVTCFYAPRAYGLPYRYAKAKVKYEGESLQWRSRRSSDGAELIGSTSNKGPLQSSDSNTLEHYFFERYCLYTEHQGCIRRAYVYHQPWSFTEAEVNLESNSLLESYNMGLDALSPDLIHYSQGLLVKTWPIEVAEKIHVDDRRDFLFLDGDCGLCHRLATFIDKRLGKGKNLGYRPILDEDAQRVIQTLPTKLRDADSVYLIRNGKPYIRSAAGIRCVLYMRWYYKMWFPVLWLIPLPLRNIGYRLIARFRHKFFKRPSECLFRVD